LLKYHNRRINKNIPMHSKQLKTARGKQKAAATQQPTTVWRFGRSRLLMHLPQSRALTQIAKVICGRAFVSVHLRPVSTHSHSSFGHSSQVLGTTAQIKLATSPYLYVVCNAGAKTGNRAQRQKRKQIMHRIRTCPEFS